LKALVTGGTGFVGSHVVWALLDAGHSARVLHRSSSKLGALKGLTYESALGDILDEAALHTASQGCDWVFHVAAVADYWRADKSRMFEANVEGTRRVLKAARDTGVKRVIFTSSAGAIGLRPDGQPADENVPFNLSPDRFPYGYSKVLAEQVALEAVSAGQDVVILNPVIVMGPGDLNMISGNFVTQVKRLGPLVPVPPGGIAVIDVRDVARMHLSAAERGRSGQRYILNTTNYSQHRWLGMIAAVVGRRRPFLPAPAFALPVAGALIDWLQKMNIKTPIDGNQTRLGARNIHFDGAKGWAELGKPQIDMLQSLQDTYRWYQDNGYIKP
jgi:dihydroflavonol-4-reductase